jgi:alpha-D-ribose 1-methylphosphonate 5-triphosphate diphosphatase
MSRALGPLQFAGGHALIDGQLTDAPVAIHDGLIVDGDMTPSIDTTGYYVLPGIIDMHGDAFERHLAPRPSAPFPYLTGLIGTERDCAANGVTTAWLAQSWSWEGGARSPDACEALLAALAG